jgi:Fur family ferric uptake transcriptional regulator
MGVVRRTISVKTLLEVFENTDEAVSSVALVDRLQKNMNKTTVYRILERLEDEGIIHSFSDKSGLSWYARCKDCSASHHHDVHPHFQCSNCGKRECLDVDITVPSIPNHQIDSAEFLLVGRCKECIS